jgi:hypothetical protein
MYWIYLLFILIFLLYTILNRFLSKIHEPFINIIDMMDDLVDKNMEDNYLENNQPLNNQSLNNQLFDNSSIIKYIYIQKKNENYYFLNKNKKVYMKFTVTKNNNNYIYKIQNYNHQTIGKFLNKYYNKLSFEINMYTQPIHFEYFNNYDNLKIYLENSTHQFYIKKIKNKYLIYYYELHIGNIHIINDLYKISVFDEYKIYINLFGIGFILLLNY